MKKIFFAIAIVLTLGLTANAQSYKDSFVDAWESNSRSDWGGAIDLLLPTGAIGGTDNQSGAPLGSGLLVLTALGAGYAVAKKRKK